MQVYLTIRGVIGSGGAHYLYVKKREMNSWWKGAQSSAPALVNQAGQYAFIGGKADSGVYINEVLRELKEEGGIALDNRHLTLNCVKTTTYYLFYVFDTSNLNLSDCCRDLAANVAPSSNRNQPNSGAVKDWEWDFVGLATKADLVANMGKTLPLTDPIAQGKISRGDFKPYSQDTNWYSEMANALPD
jgi:8-oxo-dGTP pyrophosphatase MutT (NUDIX family)